MITVDCLSDASAYLFRHSVVLFDLDDTLYSEIDYVKSGYDEIARLHPEIENMAQKLWDAFLCGEPAIDSVLNKEGVFTEALKQSCLRIYREHIPRISLYPEAQELIFSLKSKGIRLGIITDGRPEGQRAKIAALDLSQYFERIIITDELGGIAFRKPNAAAFWEMQQFFGVPFDQMVYVGDNAAKDFAAPQQLNMGSVCFRNPLGLYYNRKNGA